MSDVEKQIAVVSRQLAGELQSTRQRLVLAESCTGGGIAAALTAIEGISEWFCGSAVTYRNDTKARWLGVSREDLENPQIGPVSPGVAREMCQGTLRGTPEADLAAAITGHLGPNAPPELDGVVYIGITLRGGTPVVQRRTLSRLTPPGISLRQTRRSSAVLLVLEALLQFLERMKTETGGGKDH